jgi:hypothetical protein
VTILWDMNATHFTPADHAPRALAADLDWARFAIAQGIRPPSAITVGELLDDYRRDAEVERTVIETTGVELDREAS